MTNFSFQQVARPTRKPNLQTPGAPHLQPTVPTATNTLGSLILIGCKLGRTAALPIIALKAGAEPYRFLIARQICAWGTRRAIHFSIWFPARDKLTDVD